VTDYYTDDVTLLPSSTVLRGGLNGHWPWGMRLLVLGMKFVGRRFRATSGLPHPPRMQRLGVSQLPMSLQPRIASTLSEAAELGFEEVLMGKNLSIGSTAKYGCIFCNRERTTVLNVLAIRAQVGRASGQAWVAGLRTDLLGGRVLLTGSSSHRGYEALLGKRYEFHLFPESTSLAELFRHHQRRLQDEPSDTEIQMLGEDLQDIQAFLARRAMNEFEELIRIRLLRKLSNSEVRRLEGVVVDFD
jgi:hypothetical protein